MTISAFQGPIVGFGASGSVRAADYNPEEGPSLFWGGVGVLDPRRSVGYSTGQAFGNPTTGWLAATKIMTLNVIPVAKSNTLIAAAQHTVANVPLTLASVNATGLAVGVNGSLFGAQTTSAMKNALCLDPLVASASVNLTAGSNIMEVVTPNTGTAVGYNRFAIGMALTDTTTAANLPVATRIIGYLTGNGSGGTYLLSANATATAAGDTVTGIFSGNGSTPIDGTLTPPGSFNTIPFGSAGTIQLWLPEAMCSRCVSVTSTTSQVAGATITIVGADVFAHAMTEIITLSGAGATTTSGKKAFKYIFSATSNTTDATGNYSIGTTDIIGLPLRSDNFTPVVGTEWDISFYYNTAGVATTTGYTNAVTSTPTGSTGDVRGTYALQAAANGTLRLIATQSPVPAAMGVGTRAVGLYGQPQFTTI